MKRALWRLLLTLRVRVLDRHRYRNLVLEHVDGVPLVVLPQVFNPKLLRSGELLVRQLARADLLHHYITKHIKPALGTRPIAKITAQEVQVFLNQKANSKLRPRTVQYLHGILRAALNRAVKWQVI